MEVKEIKEKLEAMVPDFARKVLLVYRYTEWVWSSGKTKPHIPSLGEIENTLYRLINGLTEERQSSTTGGLEAYYSQPSEYEPGHYGLGFTFEEQESFATEGKTEPTYFTPDAPGLPKSEFAKAPPPARLGEQ